MRRALLTILAPLLSLGCPHPTPEAPKEKDLSAGVFEIYSDEAARKKIDAFAAEYLALLTEAKTVRRAVSSLRALAEERGVGALAKGEALREGERRYRDFKGKNLALFA